MSGKKIAIVGAGPCGMTLGLLLNKMGFKDFALFEAKSESQIINSHPAAHYLNSRSMEIFNSISGLGDEIRRNSEDLDKFRNYRYCRRVGGFQFQVNDQLSPDIMERLRSLSMQDPCHLPQNKLAKVMLDYFKGHSSLQESLHLSTNVEELLQQESGVHR